MSKYCADCKYLNTKEEKVEGIYKCKLSKEFTCACNGACQKFEENYGLNSYEKQKLFDLGKNVNLNQTPCGIYLFILLFLIIFGMLLKMLGY